MTWGERKPMDIDVTNLIQRAKAGDESSLGKLLSTQRKYLVLLARVEVGRHMQGKIDASDIVQETFLEAHRGFVRFEGDAEPQFTSWLRSILAHTLANTMRRYFGTKARDPRLEIQIAADIDRSAMSIGGMLVAPGSSPSQQVMRAEQSRLAIEALSRLPEDYETVLILRHLEGLTFPEIAQRMERTVNSVEKLWIRGLSRLRKEFAIHSSHSET
jgi:RNA polymerase sigma-70 factor, ECF subfamily